MSTADDSPCPRGPQRLVDGLESSQGLSEQHAFLKMLDADRSLHARPADAQSFYYALKLVEGVEVDLNSRLDTDDV
jgi:hypothetical protein